MYKLGAIFIIFIIFIILLAVLFVTQSKKQPETFYSNTTHTTTTPSTPTNLVLVTSVINVVDKPLAYAATRSVFTIDDRVTQTINSFETIRSKIPNAFIVLIEGSDLDTNQKEKLSRACDHIHYVSDTAKEFINGPFKGLGEVSILLDFLEQTKQLQYKTITKLSGRYYLDQVYDFGALPIDKFCVPLPNPEWKITSSYRVPMIYYQDYIKELQRVRAFYMNRTEQYEVSLESIMFDGIPPENIYYIKPPNRYGVTGLIAVNGELNEAFSHPPPHPI